jgi:hypothetical protein
MTALYCDSFLQLKRLLRWRTSGLYIKLCALAYSFEGNHADPEILLESLKYVKKNTPWYSQLRASGVYTAACITASRKHIENEFPRFAECYKILKRSGFHSSGYLSAAAYALYSTTQQNLEQNKVEKAKIIYDAMRKQHPFLTSSDDYASAVILASSDRTVDDLITDAETTYKMLKESGLYIGNGLQFLSYILVFDKESPENKATRCKQIISCLRDYKYRVSSMYYGTIGFLALTGDRCEEAIKDVMDVIAFMKENQCHGLGEKEFNLMIAAAVVCKSYLGRNESSEKTAILRIGLDATVQAIIAAQVAACAAASAAAASASSSS